VIHSVKTCGGWREVSVGGFGAMLVMLHMYSGEVLNTPVAPVAAQ
jgi:hypothetical protein